MYVPSILASHAELSIADKGAIRVARRIALIGLLVFMYRQTPTSFRDLLRRRSRLTAGISGAHE
jgi:hypothetical protein